MRGKPKHRDRSWQRSGAGTEQLMLFSVGGWLLLRVPLFGWRRSVLNGSSVTVDGRAQTTLGPSVRGENPEALFAKCRPLLSVFFGVVPST